MVDADRFEARGLRAGLFGFASFGRSVHDLGGASDSGWANLERYRLKYEAEAAPGAPAALKSGGAGASRLAEQNPLGFRGRHRRFAEVAVPRGPKIITGFICHPREREDPERHVSPAVRWRPGRTGPSRKEHVAFWTPSVAGMTSIPESDVSLRSRSIPLSTVGRVVAGGRCSRRSAKASGKPRIHRRSRGSIRVPLFPNSQSARVRRSARLNIMRKI